MKNSKKSVVQHVKVLNNKMETQQIRIFLNEMIVFNYLLHLTSLLHILKVKFYLRIG